MSFKAALLLLIVGALLSIIVIFLQHKEIAVLSNDSTMNKDLAIIIDSHFTFEEAVSGKEIPAEIANNLRLVTIEYISFDGLLHRGQLLVHVSVVEEVVKLFAKILEQRFPIEKAVPVAAFSWDDEASMQANNTSSFNFRFIYGTTTLSRHAYGLAIDINPKLNPYIAKDGSMHPKDAVYDPLRPGTLIESDAVVKLFKDYGWKWGGSWEDPKDWQHFEK